MTRMDNPTPIEVAGGRVFTPAGATEVVVATVMGEMATCFKFVDATTHRSVLVPRGQVVAVSGEMDGAA